MVPDRAGRGCRAADHRWSRGLAVLVAVVLCATTWACGADPACPAGTSGSSCIPFDDVGSQPDVQSVANDSDVMTYSLPDAAVPDGDAIGDGVASGATHDNPDTTDTTGNDQDEADGPGAPEARGTPGTRAGPDRSTIATTIATDWKGDSPSCREGSLHAPPGGLAADLPVQTPLHGPRTVA